MNIITSDTNRTRCFDTLERLTHLTQESGTLRHQLEKRNALLEAMEIAKYIPKREKSRQRTHLKHHIKAA